MTETRGGDRFFDRVVAATPGGEKLALCLQCGTCGGSCPSGPDMDHTPRQLFAMIAADMEEEVLNSNTPWYCVSCYYCTVRCPQQIPITDIMYTLKRMAVQKGKFKEAEAADFSKTFIGMVELYGRSFELGLATRYHLAHHPLKMIQMSGMGLKMLQRGRMALRPEKIKRLDQLQAILEKAKQLSAQTGGAA